MSETTGEQGEGEAKVSDHDMRNAVHASMLTLAVVRLKLERGDEIAALEALDILERELERIGRGLESRREGGEGRRAEDRVRGVGGRAGGSL